eukprot:CAMPEP_0201239940 /NCGR_PEP_ID=MMETSP0852-20130820/27380_1 /ASSEMBLY_ACC=CAM_ASM_000632 /TAXON_ID=183588 /ORGANISM="Pseudo-nitzschia fraudulenta, Strain WWA7" /LENGTH=54 /DNA_ID=CAMNT_0047535565 /DNA_START=116 /DNA_END=275 /DNA_ORIENTATION=-
MIPSSSSVEEGGRQAVLPGTPRAPDPVGVRVDAPRREVVVDDVGYVGNVQPASR